MIENIQKTLESPIGIMVIITTLMFVFCLNKYFKKNKKPRGYTMSSSPYFETNIIGSMIVLFGMISLFVIMYIFDIRDENGATLFGHIVLFNVMFYVFFPLYLFYGYKRIYFNKKEIIVLGFMKKTKTYYWEDIINVVNRQKDKITVMTTNGKFTVDNEFENVKKFLKILEEKNIQVKNITLTGKQIN